METYKTGTVNTIINENGVDLGNINVNLYTMDNMTSVIDIHLKKKNLISEQQEYIPVNFNQTKFKPILHVFAQDGSIFTNEPLEIIKPEEGYVRYIIPEYITKHVGQMQCKLFLENPENNDSSHVANFYFTVNDSGITKSVGKEIRVELLDDIVEKVMKNNVEIFKGPKGDKGEQGIPGQDGKDGKNGLNGIDGVNGNPGPQGPPGKDGRDGVNGKDGEKGEPFKYTDFTTEQLNNLKGPKGDPFKYTDFTQSQLDALKGPKGDVNISDTGWIPLTLLNNIQNSTQPNFSFGQVTSYRIVTIGTIKSVTVRGAITNVSGVNGTLSKLPMEIIGNNIPVFSVRVSTLSKNVLIFPMNDGSLRYYASTSMSTDDIVQFSGTWYI
ncbi:BppU family phage baseplate upper protein [Staphylococcus epidermidis]|uniref:BppU family phage baseplate upper protein n=1 Tax=Staphylococcus epidermidis TaxID=1282 RepID=UPI0021A950CC|nr:BppU family phage baseplate upper protein [Staphylococcus epidermidis]MCT1762870.1 BppU family phage baseplate upper protein [Staphylococcus epidermidis]MCT1832887.1 BppU family phage baseplate upper protein [Staphylococcus epidermidis]